MGSRPSSEPGIARRAHGVVLERAAPCAAHNTATGADAFLCIPGSSAQGPPKAISFMFLEALPYGGEIPMVEVSEKWGKSKVFFLCRGESKTGRLWMSKPD